MTAVGVDVGVGDAFAVGVGEAFTVGVGEGLFIVDVVDVGGAVTSAQAARKMVPSIDARAIATIILWISSRTSIIDASSRSCYSLTLYLGFHAPHSPLALKC